MRPAVFLDRDGTLIEDRGTLKSPSDVVFFGDTIDALRKLQERFLLFIVTNQPGVAEGVMSVQDVERVNAHVVATLARAGVEIRDVYTCPHSRGDGCACMKPQPHFLLVAARDHDADLRRSFVVGDHPRDVELARAVGARGIYVLSGHGVKHRMELPEDVIVVPGIAGAGAVIASCSRAAGAAGAGVSRIRQAAEVIAAGGVVAFPTETVYGLGANARDPVAVARVFEIKARPTLDPLIVHVCSIEEAERSVLDLPEPARRLAERFWPGPLTLVLRKRPCVPDIVTAGLPTVAIRVPAHPVALDLIRESRVPIAAPSANRFGSVSPTTAAHVLEQLGDDVDLVLDGGPCDVGVESTIVAFTGSRPIVLRPGGTTIEEIERCVGPVAVCSSSTARPLCPGTFSRHYAPGTPLLVSRELPPRRERHRAGILSFREPEDADGFAAVEVLSRSGDLREAAANLFAAVRRLDSLNLDVIIADLLPECGLGIAINDRLRRAAHGAPGDGVSPGRTGR